MYQETVVQGRKNGLQKDEIGEDSSLVSFHRNYLQVLSITSE